MIESKKWDQGAAIYEKQEPGYTAFIDSIKNTCQGRGVEIKTLWDREKERRSNAEKG